MKKTMDQDGMRYDINVTDLDGRGWDATNRGLPGEEALLYIQAAFTGATKTAAGWITHKPVQQVRLEVTAAVAGQLVDPWTHDGHRLYYRLGQLTEDQALQLATALVESGQLPAAFAAAAVPGPDNRAPRLGDVDDLVAGWLAALDPAPEANPPYTLPAEAIATARRWVAEAGTFQDGAPATTLEAELAEAAADHQVSLDEVRAELALQEAEAAATASRRRDAAIVAAREAGASLRAIATRVGLTHPGVRKIIDRSTR